jgi:hypothetical protein
MFSNLKFFLALTLAVSTRLRFTDASLYPTDPVVKSILHGDAWATLTWRDSDSGADSGSAPSLHQLGMLAIDLFVNEGVDGTDGPVSSFSWLFFTLFPLVFGVVGTWYDGLEANGHRQS